MLEQLGEAMRTGDCSWRIGRMNQGHQVAAEGRIVGDSELDVFCGWVVCSICGSIDTISIRSAQIHFLAIIQRDKCGSTTGCCVNFAPTHSVSTIIQIK